MKPHILPVTFCAFLLNTASLYSQTENGITGIWRGTSICQVKDSPCHDETVVYLIVSSGERTYTIKMNKVVDGEELEMGELEFTYEESTGTLTCQRDDRHRSLWVFEITENMMQGSLTIDGSVLYRLINAKKESE